MILLISASVRTAAADPLTLTWSPNPPEEQVLGYLVFVGDTPGVYPEVYDVGNQTTFTYQKATAGQEYFFEVVAYNAEGGGLPADLSGFSNAPPTLVNPGNQMNSVGEAVALQLAGSDIYGEALSYSAPGLPPGFTVNQSTGLISGSGTEAGIYIVTAGVTDGLLSAQQPFAWLIDGGPPTVTITSPTTQPTYSIASNTVALSGVAADDVGIAVVTWTSSGGGVGVATGTAAWSVPAVPLVLGTNVITVTAQDAAGHFATAVIVVTSVEPSPPTVTITRPTTAPSYVSGSNSIELGGTASDGVGVTAITWATDRGVSGTAVINTSLPPTATSWTEPAVSLLPGENVITVTAWNASDKSSTATIAVIQNRAPTFANPGDRANAEGDVVALQLAAIDSDGDPVTYTAAGLPPGLTLNATSGLISGTLPYTAAGVYATTLAVSDPLSTTYAFLTWSVSNTPLTVSPIVIAANKLYNRTTAATLASCTVTGGWGPGLIAAYSFDEGAGTTVTDSSGHGNHGSIFSATWIAGGRHGGGLSVEANGTHVRVPDSPSFDLTTGMTLEAWIKPEAVTSEWRDVIYKGNDSYYLSATSTTDGRPAAGATFGSSIVEAYGPAQLEANAWAHLTATYDNVALRLYVNGVEVSRVDRTGSLNTTDYPLEIGGDSIFGQYFSGVIDEVRIYNVALTAAQIQADMLIGADAVGCTGTATFSSESAGGDKTVTVTDLALTGPAAAEFTLAATTATTTAAIQPKPVTVTVAAADKPYDGTTGTTLTSCTLSGVLDEDEVGCIGTATFGTPAVGAGKIVTVTNLALTGAEAGNYSLETTTTTTTAGIQPRIVTPTVIVADKRYDGTTAATLTSCTVNLVLVGCAGTAAFETPDIGTGKAATVTNLTLTGADAGNYTLAATTTTTTATIYANRAPVVTNPGAKSSIQGASVTVAITAVDPDGDNVTFSAANLPPGLTINPSTGVVSGVPTTMGVFTVVISASDASATGQASFSWSIASPFPGRASPESPSGSIAGTTPAFSWTADGLATYYLLSVSDASSSSPTQVWYRPAEAGCPSGGRCTVAAPKSLTSGLVSWMVLTWNPTGYGPWSITMNAVVDVADPGVPTPALSGPAGPIATRTPTYVWNAISNATWYQLSVSDALGVVREFWYTPSQACASAPCSGTPAVLLAIGPAQWKVRAWRTSGGGAWTAAVSFEAADSAPGIATLVSPLFPVTTLAPSFAWEAVLGTSYYLLRVTDRDNVTVDRWYLPAAAGCGLGTGICVASPGISLKAGAATWRVLTWNGSGYGPWSATREFLVEIADPAALTPAALSPTGAIIGTNVTFRWNAVAGVLSYRLSIVNNGGAPTYWWYTPAAAGCVATAECSAVPPVALLNGTAQWQVQGWTMAGFGPWSSLIALAVNIPPPPTPTLVSPSGATSATAPFRWNASANATLYYIRAFDHTGLRVDTWITPAQVGCASGGVCTLDAGVTLASGAGSWQVIAWSSSGYSPWSSTLGFVVP